METVAEPVTLLAERCAQCARAIEAISPEWYRLDFDYESRRVRSRYAPDATALCVACALETSPESERASIRKDHHEPLLARKSIAGVPGEATLFHHRTLNRHVYGAVNGVFTFDEYFCHVRGTVPDTWTIPHRLLVPDDGTAPLTLLYVGSDVYLQGVDARVALTWDLRRPASEGRLQIDGWSALSPADLSRVMEGVRVFMRQAAGRPRGTTDHTMADYEAAFRDATATLGRPPRSVEEFRDATGLSSDTVKRNLRRWGTTWGTFRRAQAAL